MYQWTHIELARHQPNGNGPKTDNDEKVQKHSDQDDSIYNTNDSTVIVASEERGESFATVKNRLLSCESAATNSNSDTEDQIEPNQIENGEMRPGSVEETQDFVDGIDGRLENDEHLQQNCDNVDKIFVEMSTQTDDTILTEFKEKKPDDSQSRPPPPPPPLPPPPSPLPPSPLIYIDPPSDVTDNSIVEKPAVVATATVEQIPVTPQQNNSQINISSTKLSSASSFCPPPPPPMNGVPGPPPLPLPTGNLWFKSDSKCSISIE